MAEFTLDKARKVAKLARLAIKEEELASYANEISAVLKTIEDLQSVDVAGVSPIVNLTVGDCPTREDVVNDGDKVDEILANAPSSEYGYFVVPKVVE